MLTRSQEVHDAIPPALNAQAFDFVVHGGDFLCGGSAFDLPTETYLRSIDEVAAAFARLEAPFYSIPGNHDCDARGELGLGRPHLRPGRGYPVASAQGVVGLNGGDLTTAL